VDVVAGGVDPGQEAEHVLLGARQAALSHGLQVVRDARPVTHTENWGGSNNDQVFADQIDSVLADVENMLAPPTTIAEQEALWASIVAQGGIAVENLVSDTDKKDNIYATAGLEAVADDKVEQLNKRVDAEDVSAKGVQGYFCRIKDGDSLQSFLERAITDGIKDFAKRFKSAEGDFSIFGFRTDLAFPAYTFESTGPEPDRMLSIGDDGIVHRGGGDTERGDPGPDANTGGLNASSGAATGGPISWEPGQPIETKAQLDAYIKNLEEKMSTVGDDAQLANVDLQNALQRQQQLVQMMSNISKMVHDTAMAIIRKIGG